MSSKRGEAGQTLVELAVALPVFCLGVIVTVQLIAFCHNMIALQFMAAKNARQLSIEEPRLPELALMHPLWGRVTPPLRRQSTQSIEPWRPFKGYAHPIRQRGYVTSLSLGTQFGRLKQMASVETLLEPPRPREE